MFYLYPPSHTATQLPEFGLCNSYAPRRRTERNRSQGPKTVEKPKAIDRSRSPITPLLSAQPRLLPLPLPDAHHHHRAVLPPSAAASLLPSPSCSGIRSRRRPARTRLRVVSPETSSTVATDAAPTAGAPPGYTLFPVITTGSLLVEVWIVGRTGWEHVHRMFCPHAFFLRIIRR